MNENRFTYQDEESDCDKVYASIKGYEDFGLEVEVMILQEMNGDATLDFRFFSANDIVDFEKADCIKIGKWHDGLELKYEIDKEYLQVSLETNGDRYMMQIKNQIEDEIIVIDAFKNDEVIEEFGYIDKHEDLPEISQQECCMCLCTQTFIDDECTECGNPQIDALHEANANAAENENLRKAFSFLGYSDEDIEQIALGNREPVKTNSIDSLQGHILNGLFYENNGSQDFKKYLDDAIELEPHGAYENWPSVSMKAEMLEQLERLDSLLKPRVQQKFIQEYRPPVESKHKLCLNGVDDEVATEDRVIEYAINRLDANPDDEKDFGFKRNEIGLEQAMYIISTYGESVVSL